MTAERLGDVLGHHELLRVVGGGPHGLVYEAFDPRLGRRVAIKTFRLDALPPDLAAGLETVLRAKALAAAGLQHPNIVAVYDCDRQGPTASLAMEFVEGENLDQHLARAGKLPALQALALVAQLLSALEVAHAHGIVHGRIEPEHLLVSRTGQLKVTGFGVPQLAGSRADGGGGGAYRAPELAHGLPVDRQADLYSAAVVAYQLLTGVLPFGRPGAAAAALPPHDLRPDLPPDVDAVFTRALARDPAARFQSAGELFAALRTAFDPPLWERPDKAAALRPEEAAAAEPQEVPEAPEVLEVPAEAGVVRRPPRVIPARRPTPHRLRTRLAVASASAAAVVAVASLLLLGETGFSIAEFAGRAPRQAAAEPAAPPAWIAETALGPAAPPPALADAAVPGTAVVVARQPEPQPAPAPPAVQVAPPVIPAPVVAPLRAEPELVRPPSRSSVRHADDTRVVGASAAPQRPPAVRRPTTLAQRQPQRPSPESACRQQELAITREVCKVAQCATDEFRRHPVCVRMHAEQRVRDQVAEQASRTR